MEIISYLTNADYKIETKELFQRSKHSKLHSFLLVLHSGVFHLSLNCIEYNIVLFFCKKRTYIQMYLWNIIFHMWNMKKKRMDWVELTTYEFLFHVCFFTRDVLCDISENHLCTLNDIQFVNNNICGKLNFSYVKTKISLLQKQKDISFYSECRLCHDIVYGRCCILWPPCEGGHGKTTAAASHLFGRVRSKTVACVAVTPAPSCCLLVPHHIIHLYTSNQHCSISTLVNNIRMGRGAAVW